MQTTLAAALSDQIVIQTATWRDLNALRRLESECFPIDAWPLWDLVGVLTLSNIVRLKAVVGGRMVGFIAGDLRREENMAWIATLGVLPEYRRRGIGNALLLECEARLDVARVRLSVRRSNHVAIHLYQRLNYRLIDAWVGYYQDGEDALVFEKRLDAPAAHQDG